NRIRIPLMPRLRVAVRPLATAFLASITFFSVHGQTPRPLGIVPNLGLPAVEQDIAALDVGHIAGSRQTADASALRDSLQRVRAGGADYIPGRVIVKFRERASDSERVAAVRSAMRNGDAFIAERPTDANFDVVSVAAAADAENAAAALRGQDAVEYA